MTTSSAGNTRGLIEARSHSCSPPSTSGLPRGIPAASLKQSYTVQTQYDEAVSSAGNTRGLIEAEECWVWFQRVPEVFRGEYPRPH